MPKDGSNKVTITGSAEAVAQAKAEIKKIVDEQSARKVLRLPLFSAVATASHHRLCSAPLPPLHPTKAAIVTPEEAEEQSQRNGMTEIAPPPPREV